MQKFQIAGYRHEKLEENGIHLAFKLDEVVGETRSLSSEMTKSQAMYVVSLAEEWILAFERNCGSAASHQATTQFIASEPEEINLHELYIAAQQKRKKATFRRDVLLRELVSNSPTSEGKLNLCLEVILSGIDSPRESQVTIEDFQALLDESSHVERNQDFFDRLESLGDDLFGCLISPFRSFGNLTPRPRSLKNNLSAYGPEPDQGTEGRLSSLRQLVLRRDSYRCKVTGILDDSLESEIPEALVRAKQFRFGGLEVAHIVPHALNELRGRLELTQERQLVWSLLNMFSPGLSNELRSQEIDTPRNAILLSKDIHSLFGRLKLWFTYIDEDSEIVRYKVETKSTYNFNTENWPSNGEVKFSKSDCSPPPDRIFLAIHRALSIASTASRAADRLDELQRDQEELKQLDGEGYDSGILSDMILRNIICF